MIVSDGGNNRYFVMSRNSNIAPHHTTVQVQSSVGRIIPFCIICGSDSSVEENSGLLLYYSELIGNVTAVSMQHAAQSKGKCVSWGVIMVYGVFEV